MNLDKKLGWIIISSVGYTVLIVSTLHFLQPDKNPAVNAISEFGNGRYGNLMTTVFFVQSIGSIALAILVTRIKPRTKKYRIGAILFILAALGDVVAGLFPADPITIETMTSSGMIHAMGGMIRFIALAVALPLLSSAMRAHEQWQPYGRTLKVLGALFVIVFLVTILVLAPSNLFGLGQRVFIVTVLIWMFLVALPFTKARKST